MSQGLPIGSYDDALEMLGHRSDPVTADVPIEIGLVKALCGLVQDGNPAYWSPEFAREHWGFELAPPAALICQFTALHWQPGGKRDAPLLCTRIPLPGTTLINAGTDSEFFGPLRVGDRLTLVETFTALSAQKTTRLGVGHFVTTSATYTNQNGELVAESQNVLFRYSPTGAGESP